MKFTAALVAGLIVGLAVPRPAVPGGAATVGIHGKLSGNRVAASGVLAGAAFVPGSSRMGRFGGGVRDEPAYLIVDATPRDAQVLLDGRLLGTAAQLLARAVQLSPGGHVVQIVAPGFKAYLAQFAAHAPFSTRVRVALVPG